MDQSTGAKPPGGQTLDRSLERDMSRFGGLLITLSCLSPSIGVFIVGSDTVRQVGNGVFLAFLAAVVLGVAMSCVYAELGSAFPHTGGEYTMVGRVLGPTAAFAILGVNLVGFCLAPALSGLGIAEYLRAVAPGVQVLPTAIVCVVAVTLIGVLNIKLNAKITGLFLAAEMASLVATAALGFAHPHRSLAQGALHPMIAAAYGGLQPVPIGLLGLAASSAIYAFNGYGAVVLLGEEIKNARHGVVAVVFWALGLAALTELLPVLGVIVGAPDLGRLAASAAPIPDFIRQAGGPVLANVISLGVALAIFNAMIAVALVGGRQLYGSARDGVFPGAVGHALTRLHPRFGSPWVATLALGAIGTACCFAPLRVLVLILANGNVALYASLCLAVMVGRRTGATARTLYRMPLYPSAPLLALLALAGVVWADLSDRDTGRPGLVATLVVLAAGAAYYRLALKRSDRWGHREPDAELAAETGI